MTATPASRSLPAMQLGDTAVADLQLVLDGVVLPWLRLGGRVTAAGPGASSGTRDGIELDVSAGVAAQAQSAGGLILTDREHTPLARFVEPRLLEVQHGEAHLAEPGCALLGGLRPERTREARLFASRAVRPDQLPAPTSERTVVVVGRPPLQGELREIHDTADPSAAGSLIVLVPTETVTADGVPPEVLMRCVEAAARADGVSPIILPTALGWRDDASDAALAAALGDAYAGQCTVLLDRHRAGWVSGLAALRASTSELSAVSGLAAEVRAELERWRPPRSRRGLVVMFTGFSGSGKSTLARDLSQHVSVATDRTVSLLDGDDVRRLLSSGLGFDRAARDLNVRRIGYVASEIARHGGTAVCAPIAPYASSRAAVRAMVEPLGDFVLIHVSTPLQECERRDLKGLYAKARAGEIAEFTGVSDPYDVPHDADLSVDTSLMTRAEALDSVIAYLTKGGWLRTGSGS
ncbi:adenylyl-sulfate kinase [Angustibacter sp. McL0619]|uniref:adenylyl-sulfate kinase n=1 Tax=Angustibacter sp. McL0619 TaxID=3415676 RepID=UPI003CE68952